jgi:hypothetical protein
VKVKIFALTSLSLLLFFAFSYAGWEKKPEFRWQQLYRYDLRQDGHQLYVNRLSLIFNYLDSANKSLVKIIPFFEIRHNIDRNVWERKELGIEVGKDIFPWFYLGEAIQKGWMREDYQWRLVYDTRSYNESETRLCLTHNLLSGNSLKLKGFVINEYTYDFDSGAGTRNELAAGLSMPLGKYVETELSWRHIDRIQYYDSDAIEASLILVF